MIVFVGFSTNKSKFALLSILIRWYEQTKYSHTYLRFYDEESKQYLIAEAGQGEVHLETQNNWTKQNKMIDEQRFDISQEDFTNMRSFVLDKLQVKYSMMQNIGIVLYDLFGVKLFMNGVNGFNCSELVKRALPVLFKSNDNKPMDFVKPSGIHKLIYGKK